MKVAAIVLGLMFVVQLATAGTATSAVQLPRQCQVSGKVLCVSKTDRKLRFVVNGHIKLVLDARFGDARGSGFRTAEGSFTIFRKEVNSWSESYGVNMPYSMYFHNGQAIHYSYSFASEGYSGASHGCINTRDLSKLAWLYKKVPLGTPVYIY